MQERHGHMILKTLQWNVGGCKIRGKNDDINVQFGNSVDGIDYISKIIRQYTPHIITFQEMHFDETKDQAHIIAQKLGYQYVKTHILENQSHLDKTKKWGLGILSKYRINGSVFKPFINLHWTRTNPNNNSEIWNSFNYGADSITISVSTSNELEILNVHIPSYHTYREDPLAEKNKLLRQDIVSKLTITKDRLIMMGDFNFDNTSLHKFLPEILQNGLNEVILDKPTTPLKNFNDHILFKGIKHLKSIIVEDLLTDHYPIFSEFEI